VPLEQQRPGRAERDRKKNRKKNRKTDKHRTIAPTAGERNAIFPKLCVMIENVETIRKVAIIFRSNAQFLLQGARENSG